MSGTSGRGRMRPLVPPQRNMAIQTSPNVKRYQRQKLSAVLGSGATTLICLAFVACFAGPEIDRRLQTWIGTERWLRLLALAVLYGSALEVLSLPFEFWSGFVVEQRHGLGTQALSGWVRKRVKGYLLGGPFGLALLAGLYALLWEAGSWWWFWAAGGWLILTLILGRVVPVVILPLFYRVTPLDDADLLARFRRLTTGTGLRLNGVFRWHLSEETRKANAALIGLGRSRRLLLGDTLLAHFTPDEIEVVFAHELGHHVHRHLPKLLAWSVATTTATFLLTDVLLRPAAKALGYASLEDPAALPLLLLFLGAVALLLTPVEHALSRAFERQCDRFALARTGHMSAYRSVLSKLAQLNQVDPAPHPLVVWLFHDHPPIAERLTLEPHPCRREVPALMIV